MLNEILMLIITFFSSFFFCVSLIRSGNSSTSAVLFVEFLISNMATNDHGK